MNSDVILYLILGGIPGFGPVTQTRLLNLCGSVRDCFEAEEEELIEMDQANARKDSESRIGDKKLELFFAARNDEGMSAKARKRLQRCREEGIAVITREDDLYPRRMLGLKDMPAVLYVRGDLRINSYERAVGIVGAQKYSPEGEFSSIGIAEEEAGMGAAVISGLAKGVDCFAHTAALREGGYTIAVLGSGPERCYPEELMPLYDEIAERGCILSEYPPGSQPRRFMFPARNRLIAALSDTVYVVDAGRRSGSDSTVEACMKYGREVVQ